MEQFTWPPPRQENKTPPEKNNNGAASKVDFNPDHTPAVATRQSRATISQRTKTAAILRLFIDRGERGLNCFEAVRLAHDYVLRSIDEKGRQRAAELLGISHEVAA